MGHWHEDLLPELAAAGYAGVWGDPPGRRAAFSVGCAVLWRPSCGVHLTWSDPQPRVLVCEFELSARSVAVATTSRWSSGGDSGVVTVPAETIAAAHKVSAEAAEGKFKISKGGEGTQRLSVACVHLEGRRGAGRSRIEQLRGALRSLEHRAAAVAAATPILLSTTASDASMSTAPLAPPSRTNQSRRSQVVAGRRRHSGSSSSGSTNSGSKSRLPPCIVCGDFNSGPKSPPVQLLKLGRLPSGKVSDRGFNLKVRFKST